MAALSRFYSHSGRYVCHSTQFQFLRHVDTAIVLYSNRCSRTFHVSKLLLLQPFLLRDIGTQIVIKI